MIKNIEVLSVACSPFTAEYSMCAGQDSASPGLLPGSSRYVSPVQADSDNFAAVLVFSHSCSGDDTTGIVCRTNTSSHWIKMLCLTKKCEGLQK